MPFGLKGKLGYALQSNGLEFSLNSAQGFDEFMNLVIDDAVEVRLPTKTEEEKRRPLGTGDFHVLLHLLFFRLNFRLQDKYY